MCGCAHVWVCWCDVGVLMCVGTHVMQCDDVGVLMLCSVLMLDEAHERTLCTDMLAGLLKKVCDLPCVKAVHLSVSSCVCACLCV